jgi:LPXTG-motif cell wall-anchored protein
MDTLLQGALWVGAFVVLLLLMVRRRRRKAM